MALNLPNAIVQKVARWQALKYKNDNLVLWDTPCILTPIQMEAYKNLICSKELGINYKVLQYLTAKLQAKTGVNIVNKQFGYAETLQDKKRLLDFNLGQFEMLGLGKVEIVKNNFENLEFIFKADSTYAHEYAAMTGQQKESVDITMAGMFAGCLGEICGQDLFCLEKKCVAKGDTSCEFVIKLTKNWDKKDIKDFSVFLNKDYEKNLLSKWKVFKK